MANSSMFVLPTVTVPASIRRWMAVAVYGAVKSASIREPQVVRQPSMQNTSLWAIGMPVRGVADPFARRASARRAAASASCSSMVIRQFSDSLSRTAVFSVCPTNSTLE